MEKMIKFRSFFYYTERPAIGVPGQSLLAEQMAYFGEVHDIPREEDIARGEELGAFFTDEEKEKIEAGTYDGPEAALLGQPGSTTPPLTPEEEAATRPAMPQGEGTTGVTEIDPQEADAETIALYIRANRLTVGDTVDLAKIDGEFDDDLAEKVLDAENLATDNEPRKGVVEALEAVPTGGN